MQKIQYIKNYRDKKVGDVEAVGNNVAHGLIENNVAILYKGRIFEAPRDTMMRPEIKKKRRRRRYRTKKLE